MAKPEFTPDALTLRFRFSFHQKRMNEAKHLKIISDIIVSKINRPLTIKCLYDKDVELNHEPIGSQNASAQGASNTLMVPPDSLATVSNIFGDVELLES